MLVRIALAVLRCCGGSRMRSGCSREEAVEQEAYVWQMSRLAALEPALLDYQERAPAELLEQLVRSKNQHRQDVLHALNDLRVDAGARSCCRCWSGPISVRSSRAIELLDLVEEPEGGAVAAQLCRPAGADGPARCSGANAIRRRASLRWLPAFRTGPMLRSLRGHGSIETESFLILAAHDWDPIYRQAACSSLGWWEPMQRAQVIECLHECRSDPSPEVRQTARAALARLGERQALYWFRHALTAEDTDNVHEAMHLIGVENLFLLWPDLDRLADSENLDIAHHARETLENLCEDMDRSRGM